MSGTVSAAAIWGSQDVTSAAGEAAAVIANFSAATTGWINVQAYSRLTVRFENGSSNAATVTVETRVHPDQAVGIDRYGPTAQSGDSVTSILDKADIMNVHSFRIMHSGTADTHTIYFLAK